MLSTLSFGIFRITDPPGLDVILNCQAKEAFHPHPDRAIYTVSVFFFKIIISIFILLTENQLLFPFRMPTKVMFK